MASAETYISDALNPTQSLLSEDEELDLAVNDETSVQECLCLNRKKRGMQTKEHGPRMEIVSLYKIYKIYEFYHYEYKKLKFLSRLVDYLLNDEKEFCSQIYALNIDNVAQIYITRLQALRDSLIFKYNINDFEQFYVFLANPRYAYLLSFYDDVLEAELRRHSDYLKKLWPHIATVDVEVHLANVSSNDLENMEKALFYSVQRRTHKGTRAPNDYTLSTYRVLIFSIMIAKSHLIFDCRKATKYLSFLFLEKKYRSRAPLIVEQIFSKQAESIQNLERNESPYFVCFRQQPNSEYPQSAAPRNSRLGNDYRIDFSVFYEFLFSCDRHKLAKILDQLIFTLNI